MSSLQNAINTILKPEFRPGDIVVESGIYIVTHDPLHLVEHEVTCVRGEPFPPCSGCQHPRFKLRYVAKHLSEIPHFRKR
jgi:hypothetical protein